jgi:hypothetical protein
MKKMRITTYTRPVPTAPAMPDDWWFMSATPEQKRTLNGAKGLVRAFTKNKKSNFVVFELFNNLASMEAYDADTAVIAVKALMENYNNAHNITSMVSVNNVTA